MPLVLSSGGSGSNPALAEQNEDRIDDIETDSSGLDSRVTQIEARNDELKLTNLVVLFENAIA